MRDESIAGEKESRKKVLWEEKNPEKITVETAREQTRKQITAVLIIGMVLLFADHMSVANDTLKVKESDGQLFVTRPESDESSGSISMHVKVIGKSRELEKNVTVTLEPYESEKSADEKMSEEADDMAMSEEERLEYELRTAIDGMNGDLSVRAVGLPDRLATGEQVIWEMEEGAATNAPAIGAMMFLAVFALYKNRFAAIRKQEEENRESVMRQLPEFVNRLVLLLNAGMVLNSAFVKTIEESLRFQRNADDYFNRRLQDIYVSVKNANGSIHGEFRRFAKESGVRELMRVSNIIHDNISKGTELTGKLQNESEILWISRKKHAEEKGRLAETKLTLPLVIFLMVLIVITVAPALLEL